MSQVKLKVNDVEVFFIIDADTFCENYQSLDVDSKIIIITSDGIQ